MKKLLIIWVLVAASVSSLFAQNRTVTGKVTSSEDGGGLPGVSISTKGSSKGTTSSADGSYSISVGDGASLVFSFVGYNSQSITVGNRSVVDVKLTVDNTQLSEVVVVGYGTQQKVNLTGAVGVATSERIQNRPIANVGEGLQGVIPNLNVNVRNGDPSQSPTFNIRGFQSINGGSPLILVDNVPMDVNRINPNDIKSVSVLKDASAAAVYGARAAFGVILIETKSGSAGKVQVNVSSQFSMAKPIFNMDVVTDPYEFVLARNKANIRTSGVPAYDADYLEKTQRYSENPTKENAWGVVNGQLRYYGFNNYQNQIMTDFAPTDQHDVSVSGGSEKSTYYLSLGYLNKDGYIKPANNEKFTRYNLMMKADFKINKWITFVNRQQKVDR